LPEPEYALTGRTDSDDRRIRRAPRLDAPVVYSLRAVSIMISL